MNLPLLLTLPRNGSKFRAGTIEKLIEGDYFSFYNGSGACQFIEVVKVYKNGKLKIRYQNSNGIHTINSESNEVVDLY